MDATSIRALTADEVLTTTRSVRRRLDLARPVEPALIRECVEVALQAPSASNMQNWHFIVVTEPKTRRALAELYRQAWAIYTTMPLAAANLRFDDPARNATQQRVMRSAGYLAEHLHDVPVHVIPCIALRTDDQPVVMQAAVWGSICPAIWSFMLAARARGLGSAWTGMHLMFEEEAASILGIPHAGVMQAALIPVAHTRGGGFNPAPRAALDTVLHWNGW